MTKMMFAEISPVLCGCKLEEFWLFLSLIMINYNCYTNGWYLLGYKRCPRAFYWITGPDLELDNLTYFYFHVIWIFTIILFKVQTNSEYNWHVIWNEMYINVEIVLWLLTLMFMFSWHTAGYTLTQYTTEL